MGNVYLCRVDKNNLIPKQQKQNNKDLNNYYDINKEINTKNASDDSSKISCIKLDKNSNNKSLSNNNSIYKMNKFENKSEKNNNFYDSDIVPTTKDVFNEFISHQLNTKRKLLNKINKDKDILENKNSQSDQSIFNTQKKELLISQSNNSKVSNNIIPLPQIVHLVTDASENIPCLNFDTKDIINVAIGDSDIIRFENLTNVNFENEGESYYYTQIKNYQNENEHIKYCEGAICFMSNNHFLLLLAPLLDYSSLIDYNRISYMNKTITTYEVIHGEIILSNFLVPFDFDGDRFLYLEYESENTRKIYIHYTLKKERPLMFKIDKSFGHVSFMKFIGLNRIILCKKNKICEIRDINNNFNLIETWQNIGEEIIAMNVYIKGDKDEEDEKFENSLTDLCYKKNKENINDLEYVDTNYKKNKKSKSKNKLNLNENKNGINTKIHLKKFLKEKEKVNNSTYRDLIELKFKNNQLKSNGEKDNEIAIYNKNKSPRGKEKEKENLTNEINNNNNNKKNIELLTNNNEYNCVQSHKEILDKNTKITYYINNKLDPTDKTIEDDAYIITVDKNGNCNKYHNGKIKTLFNLYDIKNIEQNYKDEEFFSLGFPYFVVMNHKYYAISTDHGIFVLSNKD